MTDVFNLEITNLTLLDDPGTLYSLIHVAAGVVMCVPLAAPLAGHT